VTLLVRIAIFCAGFLVMRVRGPHTRLMGRMVPALVVAVLAILPGLRRALGKKFLALLLALDVLAMSLQSAPAFFRLTDFALSNLVLTEIQSRQILAVVSVEPFLFLLIPLVLLAWAYGRRAALWGSTWATFLYLGTGLWFLGSDIAHQTLLIWQFARIALMYVVPLIVSTLALRERKEAAELGAAHARLRRHSATMEQLAVSRERNRLARDLHDTLAHSLAALAVHLEALRTLQTHDPAAAQASVADALSLARSGLEESRQAIQALREDPLQTLGLVGAMRGELRALEARTGLSAQLVVAGSEPDLTGEEARALFRIAEESLTNVERHASAHEVTVRLSFGLDRIDLLIQDDGTGFDPAAIDADHYGLTGMRERAAMIGATLEVSTLRGQGTTVLCSLKRE